ncbi:MAG: AsmA family protein [Rhodocyclales bacterium]|nr:AsmA family protein [Rhodocyclales bacterium]
MLRRLLFGLIVLIGLAVVALVVFVATFDAARYRDEIDRWAQAHLGRSLSVQGELRLALWPRLALEAQTVSLGNPPGFTSPALAEIDRLALAVDPLALLSRRLEVDALTLEGVRLHLERRPDGRENWRFDFPPAAGEAKSTVTSPSAPEGAPAAALPLALGRVAVREAYVLWYGGGRERPFVLGPLALEAGPMLPEAPVPLRVTLALSERAQASLEGRLEQWRRAPRWVGRLEVPPFDLRAWLEAQSVALDLPSSALRRVRLASDVQADAAALRLDALELTVDEIALQGRLGVDLPGDRLETSLTGTAYDGSLRLDAGLDDLTGSPHWQGEGRFEGVDVARLLTAVYGKSSLTGQGSVDFALRGRGLTAEEALRSAQGTLRAQVRDGAVQGVDVEQLLRDASAVLRGERPAGGGRGSTTFEELSGSGVLAGGVLRNDDLFGRTALFTVEGAGRVDLIHARLDYRLRLRLAATPQVQRDGPLAVLLGLPIPLEVSGPLAAPSYRVVTEELARDFAKEAIRRRLAPQEERQAQEEQPPVVPAVKEIFRGLIGR